MPGGSEWKPLVFWLDNEDGPRSDYEDDSRRAFRQASRDLQIDEIEIRFESFSTGQDLLRKLSSSGPREIAELVGCDFSLDAGDLKNGLEAVRKIQEYRYPTEILVYGAPEEYISDIELDVPGWYGSVSACRDRGKVLESIGSAARKALVKWLDKEYLRGLIISRTTDVEVKLDDLLIEFYQINNDMRNHFGIDVLQADLLGFGKKISIVQRIVKCIPDQDKEFGKAWKTEFNNDLSRLSELRNEAAHGIAGIENGEFFLINRGKKKELGRKELAEHFYNAYDAYVKLGKLGTKLKEVIKYVLSSDQSAN